MEVWSSGVACGAAEPEHLTMLDRRSSLYAELGKVCVDRQKLASMVDPDDVPVSRLDA